MYNLVRHVTYQVPHDKERNICLSCGHRARCFCFSVKLCLPSDGAVCRGEIGHSFVIPGGQINPILQDEAQHGTAQHNTTEHHGQQWTPVPVSTTHCGTVLLSLALAKTRPWWRWPRLNIAQTSGK